MRKKLYVPRVEDKNRNMRMLHISSTKDLIANSMNILEPAPIDAEGNDRQDGTYTYQSPNEKFLLFFSICYSSDIIMLKFKSF